MREWQKNLLLFAASLTLTMLAAEGALRLFWQPGGQQSVIRADALYGWSLRPGSAMHSVSSDRGLDYRIQVNALGLRDRERSRSKPPDRHRILFVGDSMVFGAGVQRPLHGVEGVALLESGEEPGDVGRGRLVVEVLDGGAVARARLLILADQVGQVLAGSRGRSAVATLSCAAIMRAPEVIPHSSPN